MCVCVYPYICACIVFSVELFCDFFHSISINIYVYLL